MLKESASSFLETLTNQQKLLVYGLVHLNRRGLEISWDFDQVLLKSEVPVLDFVDKDLGTRYSGRKIKGWNSISKWLTEDGLKPEKEALEYEDWVWTEPKIIKDALPNERLRALSLAAKRRGIKQTISTSRVHKLASTTDGQVKLHFPWLEGRVNQRRSEADGPSGENFKVAKVSEIYRRNPDVIHLDDSMTFMRKLLMACPGINVLGFPAPDERHDDLYGEMRIFFPEISIFESLIYHTID
ncbi:MAG TPA: hypothetical protein VJ227_01620 [Patescibacteria group bacterium]|nr:hypothetical protein [Patescibacteria group bacterium]